MGAYHPDLQSLTPLGQLGLDLMEIGVGVEADGITKLGKSKQNIM